jgi:acyl-CoA synthetase (AMP-forming)/AMP-acid ligase II
MSVTSLQVNLMRRVNVGDIVVRNAARRPDYPAVVDGERRFSCAAFNRWVNRIAHAFIAAGYRRGDALGIMSRNSAEFLAIYFACAKIGVVCVPCNLLWKKSEMQYVLSHAAVRGLCLQPEFLDQLAAVRLELESLRDVILLPQKSFDAPPGDAAHRSFPAFIEGMPESEPEVFVDDNDPVSYLYTSGTTSAPKGVVSSHLSIYMGALGMALDTGMSFRDRALALLPLFHTSPLNSLCTPAMVAGATVYVHPGFEANAILDLFEREDISILLALPVMYRAMLELQDKQPRRIKGLRLALYGMAPMPDHELRRLMEAFRCDFGLIFGQTEMSPVTSFFRPEHQLSHPGAAGTPAANVQIGIMDEQGNLLPTGESGEIVYRSPQVLNCYLHNEAATEAVFRHGWFHSGDVGHFDADGLLWFKDRLKDVIKSGGENIASVEVEQALYDCEPAILEVVAIGLPHERWGEAVTAIVMARTGATIDPDRVMENVRKRLSAFKCPKAVIVVDRFPKTATGKIQKAELRSRFESFYSTPRQADGRAHGQ